LYEHCFGNVHVTRKKLPKPIFVRKIRAFNVDEIDTCSIRFCTKNVLLKC